MKGVTAPRLTSWRSHGSTIACSMPFTGTATARDHKTEAKVVQVPGVMEGWHTFGLLWTFKEYVFYVDGKETWRTDAGGVCLLPQYMLLSAEVGKWAGDITEAKLPDRFLVDYVRVYDLEEDLSLQEFLLNDLFKTYARQGEVCYISFGSRYDAASNRTIYKAPPRDFLERFGGRGYSVKRASVYPSSEGRWSQKRNPETKVPDGVYEVEIVEWINANTAKVKASMGRGPLWGAGYEATVEKEKGKWRIKEHGMHWVS